MKTIVTGSRMILSWLIMTVILFSSGGCGKDNPDPKAEKLRTLAGTWRVAKVDNDGVDVTSKYNGFTLTLTTEKKYSTINGHNPWPQSGMFELDAYDLARIIRDDGVVIVILSATQNELKLSLQQDAISNGRTHGVTGQFVFSFTK